MKNVNDQNKVKKKGDILKKGQGIYKKQINVFFHFKIKKQHYTFRTSAQ